MSDQRQETIAGCTATDLLKLLALVFMLIDHSGKMLFANAPELRVLGRIAFPLYCWCMAVGAAYTRSFPRYILRMVPVFAISQPLYMVALNHGWNEPNIMLTLMVGLLGLWGLREKKWYSHIWAPVLSMVLAVLLQCNYSWQGVLLMLLLYLVRDSRRGIACVMLAFCLYWGTIGSSLKTLFGLDLTGLLDLPIGSMLKPVLRLQFMAILALPLMLMPVKGALSRYRMPKWLSYGLYPAHLLLLIGLECLQSGGVQTVYHRLMGLVF